MNETQLLDYMKRHEHMAKVGKSDTMEAALSLERRGIVERVGEWKQTHPGTIFHLTDKALNLFGLMPTPTVPQEVLVSASGNSMLQEKSMFR